MEQSPPPTLKSARPKLQFSIDPRWVILALIAVIIGMLLLWRPWHHVVPSDARTVTVTGETTVQATPDEYDFSPAYEFTNIDKSAALAAASAKSSEIVAQLKKLGVTDSQIKTTIDGNQSSPPYDGGVSSSSIIPIRPIGQSYVYTVQLTVSLRDKVISQKVQDYLTTTNPTGSVTPYPTFSETLRKQLESKARGAATLEARSKADQSARNLGFKVGSVKSVNDDNGFGSDTQPLMMGSALNTDSATNSGSSLSLQPGVNDLTYSVTVTYYIK